MLRGFHDDYKPELWQPHRAVFEPERNFGFTVDGRWISTCGAYTQPMTVPGGSVPIAAVTLVTVHPSYRRRGLLRQMMTHQLEGIAARGVEPVALLWASEAAIYGRFGYGETTVPAAPVRGDPGHCLRPAGSSSTGRSARWTGTSSSRWPSGCAQSWLADRPGALVRTDAWWEVRLHDPEPWRQGGVAYRFALHFDQDGTPDGYAHFRVKEEGPDGRAEVAVESPGRGDRAGVRGPVAVPARSRPGHAASRGTDAPLDEPLRHLVADPRAIETELATARTPDWSMSPAH